MTRDRLFRVTLHSDLAFAAFRGGLHRWGGQEVAHLGDVDAGADQLGTRRIARHHADNLPATVHDRAAAVARVDGRLRLEHACLHFLAILVTQPLDVHLPDGARGIDPQRAAAAGIAD